MFDADKAAAATRRMWIKLARELEAYAHEKAKQGIAGEAVRAARLADCAYWQATGECDTQSFKEVLGQ